MTSLVTPRLLFFHQQFFPGHSTAVRILGIGSVVRYTNSYKVKRETTNAQHMYVPMFHLAVKLARWALTALGVNQLGCRLVIGQCSVEGLNTTTRDRQQQSGDQNLGDTPRPPQLATRSEAISADWPPGQRLSLHWPPGQRLSLLTGTLPA